MNRRKIVEDLELAGWAEKKYLSSCYNEQPTQVFMRADAPELFVIVEQYRWRIIPSAFGTLRYGDRELARGSSAETLAEKLRPAVLARRGRRS